MKQNHGGEVCLTTLGQSLWSQNQLNQEANFEAMEFFMTMKQNTTLKFDEILKTKTEFVGAMKICPVETESQAQVTLNERRTVQLAQLHNVLGHVE